MARKWLAATPQNILVRMPNWVGDVVMATPVLAALRERYPDSSITAMCRGAVGELLAHDPRVDELFQFSKPSRLKKREPGRNLLRALRQGRYDLGVLLTNSLSSGWQLWRGGVRRRIGFNGDYRTFLLNRTISRPDKNSTTHQVLDYQELLRPLGVEPRPRRPELYVRDSERESVAQLLEAHGVPRNAGVVGLNPGAAYGSAKCWLPERFREITQRLLAETAHHLVYFGDGKGAPLVKSICQGMESRVVNLAGATSLRELMALIERCQVLLTNDSGPMHIAAALRTPLVALFGSTSNVKTGPYEHGRVIHKHVDCSPCYKQTCPIDFRCMRRISVDEVYEQVCELLQGVGG